MYAGITTETKYKLQNVEARIVVTFATKPIDFLFPVWRPTGVVKPSMTECALNHFISTVRQSAGAVNPES